MSGYLATLLTAPLRLNTHFSARFGSSQGLLRVRDQVRVSLRFRVRVRDKGA